ncbi:hypothetical protein [Kribbella deserti]|uniref:DUF3558 domain-containing protein n=1 Tax=Kribbella deserti TaxID=1926257 RepID=A0ABV6QJQ3_9ACTN
MGHGRRATAAGAAVLLTLALVACGSEEPVATNPSPTDTPAASETPSTGDTPATDGTPTPGSEGLNGPWAADPGQSERVQAALVAKGYTCTRHSDTAMDLRLCSYGKKYPIKQGFEPTDHAALTLLADQAGTVIAAELQAQGHGDTTLDLRRAMVSQILPAADVEVFLAGGEKLTWGMYVPSDPRGSRLEKVLVKKGFSGAFAPNSAPLTTTKEQALPKLTATGMKCHFEDGLSTEPDRLECTDSKFDAIMNEPPFDARATFTVVDEPAGINKIVVMAEHGEVPSTSNAMRRMTPHIGAIDPALKEISDWAVAGINGPSREAYFGPWRVTFQRVGGSTSFYSVTIAHQKAIGVMA